MSRRVVVVTGTGTEVGKTWTAVALVTEMLERGAPVVARKPVQSFDGEDAVTDADLLAAASGESPYEVCPPERWYPLPVAPPMAAEILGKDPISLDELLAEMKMPEGGLVLVEGVGGPRSPLADDADTVELAKAVEAELVVLVSDAELGSINSITLAAEALAPSPTLVFLNRYDDARRLHAWTRSWLEDSTGLDVAVSIAELADHVVA